MAELFHLGLTVADLERSVAFYRDVAGMDVQSTVDVDSDGFRRLTGNPRARLRTALLSSGPFHLQLVQYLDGGGPALGLGHARAGSPHLSFWWHGVAELRRRLVAQSRVPVISEIEAVVPGIESFYVSDPDGMPVEFIERSPTSG